MAVGECVDLFRGQPFQEERGHVAQERVAQSVDPLEMTEEQDQFFEVGDAQLVVEPVERVGDGVGDPLPGQNPLQIVNILAGGLDGAVLGLGDAPGEDLHPAAILGKMRGDLLAEESARLIRDGQAAVDGVVVGEGDKLHSRRAQSLAEGKGIGVAVREVEPSKQPFRRAVAMAGMKVEIGLGRHGQCGRWPYLPPTCPASRFM